mmetsp:Transcript_5694/g.7639  ORF Transcript_5694/g.7639 Transcript_5694/m.7639 type:complete len:307 (-) Transcript_5694:31-951(-)
MSLISAVPLLTAVWEISGKATCSVKTQVTLALRVMRAPSDEEVKVLTQDGRDYNAFVNLTKTAESDDESEPITLPGCGLATLLEDFKDVTIYNWVNRMRTQKTKDPKVGFLHTTFKLKSFLSGHKPPDGHPGGYDELFRALIDRWDTLVVTKKVPPAQAASKARKKEAERGAIMTLAQGQPPRKYSKPSPATGDLSSVADSIDDAMKKRLAFAQEQMDLELAARKAEREARAREAQLEREARALAARAAREDAAKIRAEEREEAAKIRAEEREEAAKIRAEEREEAARIRAEERAEAARVLRMTNK